MNNILKKILIAGEAMAVALVPSVAAVDAAARGIVKASTGEEKGEAVFQTGVAALSLIENDLGVQFAAEPDFQVGLLQAKAGFTLMAKAIAARKAAAPPNG